MIVIHVIIERVVVPGAGSLRNAQSSEQAAQWRESLTLVDQPNKLWPEHPQWEGLVREENNTRDWNKGDI